jgi:putative hemolysin
VGITLVGILAGAYGGASIAQKLADPFNALPLISPHGETVAVFLIVTCITYFSVVVGELVPKQMALNNSEKFAMRVARPMSLLSAFCTPIVVILEISAKLLMKIMGIKAEDKGVTETEIKAVIAEGVASGAIEGEEQDLIRRIIRLGDRDVKSIITHRTDVKFIDIHDTLEDVRQKISEAGHSRYPVIDGDTTRVLGIIKTKELMAKAAFDENFQVQNYLKEVVFINENTACLDALEKFRSQSVHIAAVIDEYGTFEGIFTTSDLLEAIIGLIPSNYDNGDTPHIVKREDGSWLVDGLTPIDEIHMTIGLDEIPSNADYQTIAGFLLNELKISPKAGAALEFAGYKFEIMDMDKLRIDKILISRHI